MGFELSGELSTVHCLSGSREEHFRAACLRIRRNWCPRMDECKTFRLFWKIDEQTTEPRLGRRLPWCGPGGRNLTGCAHRHDGNLLNLLARAWQPLVRRVLPGSSWTRRWKGQA